MSGCSNSHKYREQKKNLAFTIKTMQLIKKKKNYIIMANDDNIFNDDF